MSVLTLLPRNFTKTSKAKLFESFSCLIEAVDCSSSTIGCHGSRNLQESSLALILRFLQFESLIKGYCDFFWIFFYDL